MVLPFPDLVALASFASLWGDLPVAAKALLWLLGAAAAGYLAMVAVLTAGFTVPTAVVLLAGGLGAYAFTDLFFDVDTLLTDLEMYEQTGDPHAGLDVVEDLGNLISPVPPAAEPLVGEYPGSGDQSGLADQAADALGSRDRFHGIDGFED